MTLKKQLAPQRHSALIQPGAQVVFLYQYNVAAILHKALINQNN
jgi:hypothetical protein